MVTEVEKRKLMMLEQKEAGYGAANGQTGKACSNCRWFDTWGETPRCNLVMGWPEPIEPNGLCDRHEIVPPPEPQPIEVVVVEADEMDEGMAQRKNKLWDFFHSLFAQKAEPTFTGFKVLPNNRWIGVFTNNYRDREGEIFTEKAIDEYIASVKAGESDYPELWFYHIPGTKHGKVDQLWRFGHFGVASGTFDDTPFAKTLKAYYETVDDYGMSHGYWYPRSQKSGRVYNAFKTFEISPLPLEAAANSLTYWRIKTMQVTEGQKTELTAAVGKEMAEKVLSVLASGEKNADALGIDSKSFTPDAEFETLKKQVGELGTAVKGLVDLNSNLEAVKGLPAQLKAIQDGMTTIMNRQTELEKKAAAWSDLKPPASKSEDTLLADREKAVLAAVQDNAKTAGQKSIVEQMLAGMSAVGEG